MAKKFWTSEKILSVCAILISLGTFFSIVYQNQLLKKQQSASVLPYLEIWNSQSKDRYQLVLLNNGIGPAFITNIRVYHMEKSHDMDPYVFLKTVLNPDDTIKRTIYYSNILPGRLIPAGERVEMIGAKDDEKTASYLRQYFANDSTAKVEIEYESVYGERWVVSGHSSQPFPLD